MSASTTTAAATSSGTAAADEPRRPGAYAVATEARGEPVFYKLTVPENTAPGDTFTFSANNRRGLTARCPTTSRPGDVLQIAIPPEPETHHTPLKMGTLTSVNQHHHHHNPDHSDSHGGRKPMLPQVQTANRDMLQATAELFVTIVPPDVRPGQKFIAQTPTGDKLVVTCPSNAQGGDKLRFQIPHIGRNDNAENNNNNNNNNNNAEPQLVDNNNNSKNDDTNGDHLIDDKEQKEGDKNDAMSNNNTKLFQITAPEGVRPNQVLPVLICGKRVPITLPSNVQPGQVLKLKLPTRQVVEGIALNYDEESSMGWTRTIRLSDHKFQWVHPEINHNTTTQVRASVYQDGTRHATWKLKYAAFVRKILYLEGNDPRFRTGMVTLIPAQDAVVESTLKHHQHHHRTLLSYATIAHIQTRPLEEKTDWFQHDICGELTTPWESGRIKILVRRDTLLQDSLRAVMALSRADMRKRWRLEFMGEPAIDSGGVTREWFQLITEQMFNPDFGLWLSSSNNQVAMLVNPASDISCPDDHLIYFRFLGRVMGRALFDRQLIHGHMVRHLYKHILGWPITFEDLEAQDEEYYQSLKSFLTMDEEGIAALCLDFSLQEETLGVRRTVDLVPNGSNIEVTTANLPQYLEAILKYRMLGRTQVQISELLLGFFDVIPEPALTVFDPNELELLLCGLPTIDMDDWEANTSYTGNFHETGATEPVVQWFWEIVRNDFDQEMKARLLQFVTGTSGVPNRGFSVLQGNDGNIKRFSIHGVDRSSYSYPRAHTCFNRIDMPNYSTKTELFEKLKSAVTLSAVGFDIE